MLTTLFIINVVLYLALVLYAKLTKGINKCSRHLVGKVVIVTGGNAGIGYETAKDLAERGAKVILGCRNVDRGVAARDEIINYTGNQDVHFKVLDLASFKSVRAFAESILKTEKQLDILINNAGIVGLTHKKTEDGLLLDMQTNHFGPFLLTSLLLPLLKSSAPSRIINVSSDLHVRGKIDLDDLNMDNGNYGPWKAYCNSKLCNVLMTVELSKQLSGTGVITNSIHPGAVVTDILQGRWWSAIAKSLSKPLYKTPWEGAQTSIYAAVSPKAGNVSGKYFSDCNLKSTSALAQDEKLAERLWQVSEKLTKLK